MNTSLTMDYRARVFRNILDGVECWKAFVVTIPAVSAEAESREAVLEEIKQQLAEAVVTSEIITVPGPIPEKVVEGDGSELDLRLRKMGYRHYGIFAGDPGALELFDEIERQRDQQTVGEYCHWHTITLDSNHGCTRRTAERDLIVDLVRRDKEKRRCTLRIRAVPYDHFDASQ